MDITEYQQVKDLTYLEYCDYLQGKYGIGLDDYMTKSYNEKRKCKRTSEGLFAHHKREDTAAKLSNKINAMIYPFEWQLKENIVYCDYLEHLLLHVLICKYPAKEKLDSEIVGIGGVTTFIVPELNDLYCGWEPKHQWRKNCFDKVKNDYMVYFDLIDRIIHFSKDNLNCSILRFLCRSSLSPCEILNEKQKQLFRIIIALHTQVWGVQYTKEYIIDSMRWLIRAF